MLWGKLSIVENDDGKSVNSAAKKFDIKRMTLTRYLKQLNDGEDSSMGYAIPRQVFSLTQEYSLKKILATNGINLLRIYSKRCPLPCL